MASRPIWRRSFRISAFLLSLLLASGCSSWSRLQPITPSAYAEAGPSSQMRVELTDGRVVTVHAPRMEGDTLRGLCATSLAARAALFTSDSPRDSCAFALRDVRTAEVKRVNVTGTVILLAVLVCLPVAFLATVASQD